MILNEILLESKAHYEDVQKKILKKLSGLPKGSVKERNISGHKYYYLQHRVGSKVVHDYLGKEKPEQLIKDIELKKSLKAELKKVKEALKMIDRANRK